MRAFRLARQHLTLRAPSELLATTVAAVGGVQAQVMSAAELALWARTDGLTPENVRGALWERRELVKTWSMRGTLHLLPATEYPLWAAALSHRAGWRKPVWLRAFDVTVEEMEGLIAALDAGLDAAGKTREEVAALAPTHMRERLLQGWGSYLKPAAYQGVLAFGPNRGRNVTFVHPRAWLGLSDPVDGEVAVREIFRRFLGTYGPATHEDFARWWGGDPGPARRVLRSIEEEVEEVEAEGRRAWLLAGDIDAVRSFEPPRAVHLLPHFDLYTLHYRPRGAFVPPDRVDRVFRQAGWISPVVLLDGAVAGVWEQRKRARRIELRVQPFVRVTKRLQAGVEREAERLASFLGLPVEVVVEG